MSAIAFGQAVVSGAACCAEAASAPSAEIASARPADFMVIISPLVSVHVWEKLAHREVRRPPDHARQDFSFAPRLICCGNPLGQGGNPDNGYLDPGYGPARFEAALAPPYRLRSLNRGLHARGLPA